MMGMDMSAMTMVHENMHQGTSQQDEQWQRTQDVSPMFCQ
jgi:hypothetical protein